MFLTAFFAGGWRILIVPLSFEEVFEVLNMTNNVEERSFYEKLLRPLEEEGQLAWSAYLFNVEKARALAAILSQDQARKMLNEGPKWAGAWWTTSRASSVLWKPGRRPVCSSKGDNLQGQLAVPPRHGPQC